MPIRKLKSTILFFLLLLSINLFAEFKVIGYLTNWGNFVQDANAVDYTKVTHINIAFLNPDNNGLMTPTNNLSTVVNIIHNGNAKAIISVGGATAPNTWDTLMKVNYRADFIHKIKNFLIQYNLDGIDIDLEGGDIDANYNPFIIQLSDSLSGTGKVLTAAVATWTGNKILNNALARFDWINIMSYDQYGTWSGAGQHSAYSVAVSDLNYWGNTRNLAKEKLILGVPFYGYRWETNGNSSLSYMQIVALFPNAENSDHIVTNTNGNIYYNGIPTIKQKTSLALSDAGGIMWWTMQFDYPTTNNKSLLKAINEVIQAATNNKKPTVSLIKPLNNQIFTEGEEIVIEANAHDTDGVISYVSFYVDNSKIGQDTGINFKYSWKTAGPGTYKIFAMVVDDSYASVMSDTIEIVVNAATQQRPFGGIPTNIPGKIEAENFDIGNTMGYYDLSAGNSGNTYRTSDVDIEDCSDNGGGYNVGWTEDGEWLEYTVNINKDTIYDIKARVATTSTNKTFYLELSGNKIAEFQIPTTGGWQKWITVTLNDIHLNAGIDTLKLVFASGSFNLNYVEFSYANPTSNLNVQSIQNNFLKIYPNPADDYLYLNYKEVDQINIYDYTGRLIISNKYNEQPLDISSLAKGIYTIMAIKNDRINCTHFIKN